MWLGVDPPESRKVCRRRTFNIKKPEAWLKSAGILEPFLSTTKKLLTRHFLVFNFRLKNPTVKPSRQNQNSVFRLSGGYLPVIRGIWVLPLGPV